MIKIDYLGRYSKFIPAVAKWHQDEWHNISPDLSTSKRIDLYNLYENKVTIPCCFIALISDEPVGSASLVVSDMESHKHLSPWLASVYVQKTNRRQGIATQLIEACLKNARDYGVKTLYLFTPDQSDFYQKRGWKKLESTLYHGEYVDIMSYNLN